MAETKYHPTRYKVYTLRQILEELVMRDEPFLRFAHESKIVVMQDGGASDADLLRIPGFAESQWAYQRETEEWIPLFMYVGDAPITDFIDIEPNKNDDFGDDPFYATPKGFYLPQFESTIN